MSSLMYADDWLLALRNQPLLSVCSAYRVGEQRGKTKLDIRLQNWTCELKTLYIAWVPANSRTILESVEKIAGLVTRRKITTFLLSQHWISKIEPKTIQVVSSLMGQPSSKLFKIDHSKKVWTEF